MTQAPCCWHSSRSALCGLRCAAVAASPAHVPFHYCCCCCHYNRFRDNRHNVSDVVGGLLLGACFAPMFFARLVWHAEGWTQIEAQEASAGELQLQALSSGASNGAAHTARHTTVLPMADDMP